MTAFADDGDEAAFAELVRRYHRPVFAFLLRFVGNRARTEELTQEVFVRLLRMKGRYRATGRFRTLVFSVARNLAIDESRRAKFRRHLSLDAPGRGRDGDPGRSLGERIAGDDVPVDDAALAPTLRTRILEAVDELPDAQREVFLMRVAGGMSFVEIAETLEISDNTVKSRMRYALEKLRVALADLDPREDGKETG
ncbi:MAG: sigma-70 family RNA polymerase sigma factor [Deltaproteobacteria bacterium]|nr:MAG: sigma-70 family RNA polymerase sigma factor [Deltaproteobacteria bacterium]